MATLNTRSVTFNSRVASMQPSATLGMSARANALAREGHDVISLSAGEPDFDTPSPVAKEGIKAIEEGFTNYTHNAGMPELRESIADKLERDNGLSYHPDEILCSNGAKQSVALGIHVLCQPGDEVLIPSPYWVSYPEMVRFAGAEPVILNTSVENGYRIEPEQLEEALSDQTRMIVLCSPSNPTGTVYTPVELERLAEVLRRHPDVYVLSDEIYEHIIFDASHRSIASFQGLKERTITVNGFSKAYAMTGWRLGYMAAPKPITSAAALVQGQLTSAPSSISQRAGIAALDLGLDPVNEMVKAFRDRRDFLITELDAIDGIRCPRPEGAFYLFPDIRAYLGTSTADGRSIGSSEDLCYYLLDEYHLAMVHGDAFGAPNGLRLSYASSMDALKQGISRLKSGLSSLT